MAWIKRLVAAAAVLGWAAVAQAAPQPLAGTFTMYYQWGTVAAVDTTVTGFIDVSAGTWGVSSTTPFFGFNWTASGGVLHHTTFDHSTVDPAPGESGGTYTGVEVTYPQLGGTIDLAWHGSTGIDVVTVCDWLQTPEGGTYSLTPIDPTVAGPNPNPDGIPGITIIEGPFQTFSATFELYEVPEPLSAPLVATAMASLLVLRRKLTAG